MLVDVLCVVFVAVCVVGVCVVGLRVWLLFVSFVGRVAVIAADAVVVARVVMVVLAL